MSCYFSFVCLFLYVRLGYFLALGSPAALRHGGYKPHRAYMHEHMFINLQTTNSMNTKTLSAIGNPKVLCLQAKKAKY